METEIKYMEGKPSNQDVENTTTLAINGTIKRYKTLLNIPNDKGFNSSTYEIIKQRIEFDMLDDSEYFEAKKKQIKEEYDKNQGHEIYYFYPTMGRGTLLNKKKTNNLFGLQRKSKLPKCHLFITNGLRNNEVKNLVNECKKKLSDRQELVITIDMDLQEDFFEFIHKEFNSYEISYVHRKRDKKNRNNYDYVRNLKDDKIRHITNVSWAFHREQLPLNFELMLNGFNSQTLIKFGGGDKSKKKNYTPYKLENVNESCMFEEDSANIKKLHKHKNKKCNCVFHNGDTVLSSEILKILGSNELGKLWLDMHNLEKISDLLKKQKEDLLKIPAIAERNIKLGILA